uniref:BHLH domain-containing protein n=1 Tax=Glossina brevipalpis TaxID=37001 RepID=A0A1A9WF50_9MUSC
MGISIEDWIYRVVEARQCGKAQVQVLWYKTLTTFDASKSTKGASKLRRDLINAEIANLRDLLPLPQSTRQRLSQLQLMALVCVYVRKANYFQQVFKRHDISLHQTPTPNMGFSKEDLLIHGDSVYDIIDKQDHAAIQAELNRNVPPQPGQHMSSIASAANAISSLEGDHRMFLCRMNVSRNARRQMRFGDQKIGFLSLLIKSRLAIKTIQYSRNEPVFLATCTPIAMPETRECVVQGATNVFTAVHSMDMKIVHIDKNGEFHLGYTRNEIQGVSWYSLIHTDNLREAQGKHRLITQSEQDRSCILLIRMQRSLGDFIWVHVVLQVRDPQDSNQQPVIVSTNQVLNDREASVMILNSWLYHYYTVQSKIQFGLPYDNVTRIGSNATSPTVNTAPAYYHHFPHHPHHHHHHHATSSGYSPTTMLGTPYASLHSPSNPHAHHHHHHFHHISQLPSTYHNAMETAADSSSSTTILERITTTNATETDAINNIINLKNLSKPTVEPVDYSQLAEVTQQHTPSPTRPPSSIKSNGGELRCESANSSISSNTSATMGHLSLSNHSYSNHNRVRSPPQKRKAIGKLEPLYIQENSQDVTNLSLNELDNYAIHANRSVALSHESHSSVIFATVVPTRPRLLNKVFSSDPADFIDQWNPSPPWSENAQKLSFENTSTTSQQELSPCITTTPPTPSAPLNSNATTCIPGLQTFGSAFSFEWMPEQLMPVVDACVTYPRTDGMPPIVMTHSHSHSHHHTHNSHCPTSWPSHVIPTDTYSHLTIQNQRLTTTDRHLSPDGRDGGQTELHTSAAQKTRIITLNDLTNEDETKKKAGSPTDHYNGARSTKAQFDKCVHSLMKVVDKGIPTLD